MQNDRKKEWIHNAISSTAIVATLIENQLLSGFEYKPGGNLKIFPKRTIKKNAYKSCSAPGNT